MIHYNVWFSFKPGEDKPSNLERVRSLLEEFKGRGMVHEFRLLANRAEAGKAKLPKYHAIIEFRDGEQFGLPFSEVERIGVHLGQHGAMIEHVDEFVVEVFEQI